MLKKTRGGFALVAILIAGCLFVLRDFRNAIVARAYALFCRSKTLSR